MTKRAIERIAGICLFLAAASGVSGETIKFDGEKTQIVFTEGKERALLRGNARVVTDTSTVTAQEIELYGKDYRYILCRGTVSAVNREDEITLTSDRLFMDRDEELTRAEGNAVMENRKDELIIKGGFIENRKKDDLAIIQIGVRILKKDMVARAEFARYRDKENRLELSGMPQVYWKGDEYRATRIIINTETDEIELQGEVSGSVKNSKEKDKKETEPASGTTPGGSAAPAGQTPPSGEGAPGGATATTPSATPSPSTATTPSPTTASPAAGSGTASAPASGSQSTGTARGTGTAGGEATKTGGTGP